MIYAYSARSFNLPHEISKELRHYARSRGLPLDQVIEDQAEQEMKWSNRLLESLFKQMQDGDTLIIYEASDIGTNFKSIAAFLGKLVDKAIKLHIIKYEKIFYGEKLMPAAELIDLVRHIESDFIAQDYVRKHMNKVKAKLLDYPSLVCGRRK